MPVIASSLSVATRGPGTIEITDRVARLVASSTLRDGVVSVFCRHTSCSLVIMENADPSARIDLERFFEDLVPESYPHFTHVYEGADDMPSHIKMALTRTSETIPFAGGRLSLGTWQGIFLWEHRNRPHSRELIVTVIGE
jgi:secondary thiamine-phosphate synthase enzyme